MVTINNGLAIMVGDYGLVIMNSMEAEQKMLH